MKYSLIYLFNLLLLSSLLAGCEQRYEYDYLVQHPILVQAEAAKCLDAKQYTPAQAEQCKLILAVKQTIVEVLNDQQEDPEAFGQRILELEADYAKSKSAWMVAQTKYQNANGQDKIKAKTDLDKAEAAYNKIKTQLHLLLSVAGLSSPE